MLSPHRQQLIDAMEAHFQSLCAPEQASRRRPHHRVSRPVLGDEQIFGQEAAQAQELLPAS